MGSYHVFLYFNSRKAPAATFGEERLSPGLHQSDCEGDMNEPEPLVPPETSTEESCVLGASCQHLRNPLLPNIHLSPGEYSQVDLRSQRSHDGMH